MLFLTLVGLVVGLVIVLNARKGLHRYHRIKNTPTTPVAQAPGTGAVEVKGRAIGGELGLHASPFTGRRGVWVSIDVQELRRQGKSSSWVSIHKESHFNPFWIDDGSGQHARIEPAGGELIVDLVQVAASGTLNDPAPHLQQFLQSRNVSPTNFLGMNKSLRFHEFVLAEGDNIYALGCSRRDPGPPVHDGYRMVPSSQLVVFHGQQERDELIISNKEEEKLAGGLRTPFITGMVVMIASAVGTVAVGISMLI